MSGYDSDEDFRLEQGEEEQEEEVVVVEQAAGQQVPGPAGPGRPKRANAGAGLAALLALHGGGQEAAGDSDDEAPAQQGGRSGTGSGRGVAAAAPAAAKAGRVGKGGRGGKAAGAPAAAAAAAAAVSAPPVTICLKGQAKPAEKRAAKGSGAPC